MKREDVKFVGFHLQNGQFISTEEFANLEGGMRLAIQHVVYSLCDNYLLYTNGGIIYLDDNAGNNGVFVCENIHITNVQKPVIVVIGQEGKYAIPLHVLSVKDDTTLYANWDLLDEAYES